MPFWHTPNSGNPEAGAGPAEEAAELDSDQTEVAVSDESVGPGYWAPTAETAAGSG